MLNELGAHLFTLDRTTRACLGSGDLLLRGASVPVFLAVAVGDGHAPVAAEGAGGDLYAGRGLAALVLGPVHQAHGALYVFFVEAGGDDLTYTLVLFHVGLEDGVEDFVGRQGVGVALVFPKLGGGLLGEDGLGDDLAPLRLVYVPADTVDEGFGDVPYYGEPAGRVAVERGVPNARLALVSGREDDPTELITESHEDVPPDPGLDVLLGLVFGEPLEGLREHLLVRIEGRSYGNLLRIYAEVLHERLCVSVALLGGVPARHEDAGHVLGT